VREINKITIRDSGRSTKLGRRVCGIHEKIRFDSGIASPCLFYHKDREIRAVVHGDDFTMLGHREDLDWFRKMIETKFEIKHKRMGSGPDELKSVRILNRIVTYTENGIEYEADQRHAEIIGKQMGLVSGSKGVATPGMKTKFVEGADELRELPPQEASKFRGLVARANYLGQDRSDIKFPVKEVSRRMPKPRYRDVENLKRLAWYLIGKPRMVTIFGKQDKPEGIVGWSDSDWAGCMETRKSTSGGLLCIGNHTIKCWSVTQAVLALSSGEAELYALVT
jgi:hypothetical protein